MSVALARKLDEIKERAGIKSRELAQLLNTTPQTVSRWQGGRVEPQPDTLNRLLTIAWLAELLSEFYPPDEARLWLFTPNRLLQGKRPAELIQIGQLDDVLGLIDQLKSSAYV